MEPAADSAAIENSRRLEWTEGRYRYSVQRRNGAAVYSVTDGTETAEIPLGYALGRSSRTWVFESNGRYFESRVSYFPSIDGLGLTPGTPRPIPATVQQALGRSLETFEARDCFGCHATGARKGDTFQLESYENGVQCEACHGPGAEHAARASRGLARPGMIRSLRGMDADRVNDLCGSCHRTAEMALALNLSGVNSIRFQPYRLSLSRCYTNDRRIACVACHNPHAAAAKGDRPYDAKCLACHGSSRQCKVAKEACTSCHMPRYELPDARQVFTDHFIRIVRDGRRPPG